jgi:poly-gamma-glutamate capsule biosynthesis protein CapA/YwtB (metallophosphatase superfamily)
MIKIALLGDIAFFGKYSTKNSRVYDYFKDAAEVLRTFDYVVGNLETPLCNSGRPYGAKSAHIRAAEDNVRLLQYLNIGIVSLANNHVFDYGLEGYEMTKRVLEEHGIKYFGVDGRQITIEQGMARVAFSGFCCYSTNGLGYKNPKTQQGVNELNAFEVEETLCDNHNKGYLNIVSIHAGQEHVNYPNYDHVAFARALARKVPYVYYGHHPHVIQGIEQVKDSLIAYSLGNFCFDDVYTDTSTKPLIIQSEENKKSFILSLHIEKNDIVETELIPLYAEEDTLSVGSRMEILDDVKTYSQRLEIRPGEYRQFRDKQLNEYLSKRRAQRDFKWYVVRLNLNSLGMVVNAKKNQARYRRLVLDYIKEW